MEEKQKATTHLPDPQSEVDELYACEWSFFEECTLAAADLFWKKSDGRLYRLAQKGDYLDHEKIKKFYDKNIKIFSQVTQVEDFENYLEELLIKFCDAEFEHDRLLARQELLSFIYQFYYLEDSHAELFDLVHVFDRRFNLLHEDHKAFLLSYPDFQRRNTVIGTLNVLGGILLGYNSENYLKDLYTIAFFYQASTYPVMTPALAKAFDKERSKKSDMTFILSELSEKEQTLFFEHMKADAELARHDFSDILNFTSSYQLLMRYHEKLNGSGFPNQLCQEEISDIEMWIILVSRTYPVSGFKYKNEDAKEILPRLFSGSLGAETLSSVFGRRVKILIESAFSSFEEFKGAS